MKLPFPPESETPEIILTKESLTFIRTWMDENSEGVPAAIRPFILAMLDLCEDAQVLLKNNKKLVELLRQHMGFIPTKEREGKGKKDPAPDEWTKEGENSLLQKMRKAQEKWKEYKSRRPKKEKKTGSALTKKTTPGTNPQGPQESEPSTPPRASDEAMFMLPAAQTNSRTEERAVASIRED